MRVPRGVPDVSTGDPDAVILLNQCIPFRCTKVAAKLAKEWGTVSTLTEKVVKRTLKRQQGENDRLQRLKTNSAAPSDTVKPTPVSGEPRRREGSIFGQAPPSFDGSFNPRSQQEEAVLPIPKHIESLLLASFQLPPKLYAVRPSNHPHEDDSTRRRDEGAVIKKPPRSIGGEEEEEGNKPTTPTDPLNPTSSQATTEIDRSEEDALRNGVVGNKSNNNNNNRISPTSTHSVVGMPPPPPPPPPPTTTRRVIVHTNHPISRHSTAAVLLLPPVVGQSRNNNNNNNPSPTPSSGLPTSTSFPIAPPAPPQPTAMVSLDNTYVLNVYIDPMEVISQCALLNNGTPPGGADRSSLAHFGFGPSPQRQLWVEWIRRSSGFYSTHKQPPPPAGDRTAAPTRSSTALSSGLLCEPLGPYPVRLHIHDTVEVATAKVLAHLHQSLLSEVGEFESTMYTTTTTPTSTEGTQQKCRKRGNTPPNPSSHDLRESGDILIDGSKQHGGRTPSTPNNNDNNIHATTLLCFATFYGAPIRFNSKPSSTIGVAAGSVVGHQSIATTHSTHASSTKARVEPSLVSGAQDGEGPGSSIGGGTGMVGLPAPRPTISNIAMMIPEGFETSPSATAPAWNYKKKAVNPYLPSLPVFHRSIICLTPLLYDLAERFMHVELDEELTSRTTMRTTREERGDQTSPQQPHGVVRWIRHASRPFGESERYNGGRMTTVAASMPVVGKAQSGGGDLCAVNPLPGIPLDPSTMVSIEGVMMAASSSQQGADSAPSSSLQTTTTIPSPLIARLPQLFFALRPCDSVGHALEGASFPSAAPDSFFDLLQQSVVGAGSAAAAATAGSSSSSTASSNALYRSVGPNLVATLGLDLNCISRRRQEIAERARQETERRRLDIERRRDEHISKIYAKRTERETNAWEHCSYRDRVVRDEIALPAVCAELRDFLREESREHKIAELIQLNEDRAQKETDRKQQVIEHIRSIVAKKIEVHDCAVKDFESMRKDEDSAFVDILREHQRRSKTISQLLRVQKHLKLLPGAVETAVLGAPLRVQL